MPSLAFLYCLSAVLGASFFTAAFLINGENQVFTKVTQDFGDSDRKGYSVARFDGSGLTDLRFYEGAFKEEHTFGTYSGGLEFKDTSYFSSPASGSSSWHQKLAA